MMKAKKATATADWTARTRARRVGGRLPPNQAAIAPKSVRINTHSSMEPSWFPQTPLILYSIGLAEWLFSQTRRSEKSEVTKA